MNSASSAASGEAEGRSPGSTGAARESGAAGALPAPAVPLARLAAAAAGRPAWYSCRASAQAMTFGGRWARTMARTTSSAQTSKIAARVKALAMPCTTAW